MTEAGSVYGEALYELAKAEDLSKAISRELTALQNSFRQEPDFIRLLNAPNLTKQERCQILERSFRDRIQPYLLNFLKILTEKGYIRHFDDCCQAYMSRYYADQNILPVTAYTAVALTDAQTEKLCRKLSDITGKEILLENRVDPAAMGGVRLDYDGKRVDGTVNNRLDSIGSLLKNTVL